MNKVIAMGRFVATPELKTTTSGIPVCSFTIAVDRQGKKETTDFLDIVAWRHTAEFICKWFEKGTPIIVEGSLQTRTYEDKNGQKRKAVEVVADNVFFIPKTKSAPANDVEPPVENNSFSAGADSDFDDDDLSW